MSRLWAVVCALALAWLAGDAVLGAIVAPELFGAAVAAPGVGRPFAGLVFGEVLVRWVTYAGLLCVIPIAGLLAAAAGRLLKQRGWRAALLPLIPALLVVAAHSTTATVVARAREQAETLRALPDAQRLHEFRTDDHRLFRAVFGTEMLLAFGLAVLAVMQAGAADGGWPNRGQLRPPSRTPPPA